MSERSKTVIRVKKLLEIVEKQCVTLSFRIAPSEKRPLTDSWHHKKKKSRTSIGKGRKEAE